VVPVVHQALGDVLGLDPVPLPGPQVDDALVGDEPRGPAVEDGKELAQPVRDVVGVEDRGARRRRPK